MEQSATRAVVAELADALGSGPSELNAHGGSNPLDRTTNKRPGPLGPGTSKQTTNKGPKGRHTSPTQARRTETETTGATWHRWIMIMYRPSGPGELLVAINPGVSTPGNLYVGTFVPFFYAGLRFKGTHTSSAQPQVQAHITNPAPSANTSPTRPRRADTRTAGAVRPRYQQTNLQQRPEGPTY